MLAPRYYFSMSSSRSIAWAYLFHFLHFTFNFAFSILVILLSSINHCLSLARCCSKAFCWLTIAKSWSMLVVTFVVSSHFPDFMTLMTFAESAASEKRKSANNRKKIFFTFSLFSQPYEMDKLKTSMYWRLKIKKKEKDDID